MLIAWIAELLRERATGLLLDRDDDAEEIRFGERHALIELGGGLAQRNSHRRGFGDGAEFALHRLLGFGRDDTDAIADRQPRLDAAHDHVDRVRQFLEEFVLAAAP